MTNLLIIEDEEDASNHLISLLEDYQEINVLKILSSVESTIEWFNNNNHPDLILMDVQLNDGVSFEIFDEIKINCPVVFITAYDEYAIKAIKLSSIDYLLKPITKFDVSKTLIKYYTKELNAYKRVNNNKSFDIKNAYKERFLVKEGNQHLPVKIEDIAYVYWSDYAFIRTVDGKSFLVNYSINQIEEMLRPDLFIRINRQVLANINSIKSLSKDKSTYLIELLPKVSSKIKLSKDSYMNLKRLLS